MPLHPTRPPSPSCGYDSLCLMLHILADQNNIMNRAEGIWVGTLFRSPALPFLHVYSCFSGKRASPRTVSPVLARPAPNVSRGHRRRLRLLRPHLAQRRTSLLRPRCRALARRRSYRLRPALLLLRLQLLPARSQALISASLLCEVHLPFSFFSPISARSVLREHRAVGTLPREAQLFALSYVPR